MPKDIDRAESMRSEKPIRVAVIGGGCGGITAAFELTRPEHRGRYHVTLYQQGWRLGGKGASGRGPADRIEEHGLHVWLGFYENAFRLLRECYAELGRNPEDCRFADWRDAFFPEPWVGLGDRTPGGEWLNWQAYFPPAEGLPGDPLTDHNPFTVTSYLKRSLALLRALLESVQANEELNDRDSRGRGRSPQEICESMHRLLKYTLLASMSGLVEAVSLLEVAFEALPRYPSGLIVELLKAFGAGVRRQIEPLIEQDPEIRRLWEIADLLISILVGCVRFRLASDPRGFDAIDSYEFRDWLRRNGASDRSLQSAFVRGLYDLAFAYERGDPSRPCIAAGQALRGFVRIFFTYRGSFFWKMRAGMGDVVFAPFYEVLRRRGVTFKFFHRLENLELTNRECLAPGESPYVEALKFSVQAETIDGREYSPLIDVRGLPCWPGRPKYSQLVDGEQLENESWDPESDWDYRKTKTKTLRVIDDFDFVVLSVGLGAIPNVCRDLVDSDSRWRLMVEKVQTVATQAFQLWLREDMKELRGSHRPMTLSAFTAPFDTWADMTHLLAEESWPRQPKSVAYFCCALPDPPILSERFTEEYPVAARKQVRTNAIRFLDRDIGHLWPGALAPEDGFRWDLLVDPRESLDRPVSDPTAAVSSRFDTQFWKANVNASDRYVLCPPGSPQYRISPLDNTYDNLTIAGDWTACGFVEGCVEAAVMSGRLAAHAISGAPDLADIVGYDHP